MEKIYVVQSYCAVDGDVLADKPVLHGIEEFARRQGESLAEERDGVIVYTQFADADRGEYSAPVILATYGQVPDLRV